ncbi:Integrase catalytic region [Truepera radiovictrix DSM 17093]|uniref:Integrase catalytic region n=1 Tax=Truepera radiovictrix (strain DSM 17093 / CIP 108686 / LMG 22925 / RQ-24) TaxID=649638 RepID=D7CVM7_TRURR|nr:Integrase catalytic region [Truepera radiovictrix DSM 17093]
MDEQVKRFAPRVGTLRACRAFGVNPRTFRHRRQAQKGQLPIRKSSPHKPRSPHPAALTTEERRQILGVLCSERFCDLPPAQVFNTLLDEGTHLCSVRQMYRLLAEHGLLFERRRGGHFRRGLYPIPQLEAAAPDQCWTRSSPLGEGSSDPNLWDITKLPGSARGVHYHLYTVLDIFSREVVGWIAEHDTVATRESEMVARELIDKSCQREGINPNQLTLHADRGSPMVARSMADLLDELGVYKSHSRPRLSNDNPYSEAQFKTLKYRPDYPQRFESIQTAHN